MGPCGEYNTLLKQLITDIIVFYRIFSVFHDIKQIATIGNKSREVYITK